MIYLVTYDLSLRVFGPSRQDFLKELQESRSWWHYISNTWLISTEERIEDLDKRLRRHIQSTDKVLIVALGNNPVYGGWLPEEAWQWLQERIRLSEHLR